MESFEKLEQELGEWAGYAPEQVVCCSSGTAALHLAFEALQLPPGSEVVVPDFTMVACARAISLSGLVPVFCDCGEDLNLNWKLLPDTFEEADPFYAIMAVHIYGRRCDMTGIHLWANRYPKFVIEDMAEAHGVKPHSDTDAACWSFYKNKVVCGEEGGAVAFRDPTHATLARQLRSLGFTKSHDFYHVPRGWNHRMSNCHARLILKSLWEFKNNVRLRREIECWYDAVCPEEWKMPARDAMWIYDVRLPGLTKMDQDRIVQALQELGIAARHGFKPMHCQEEYRNCKRVGGEVAERMSREIIYLPVVLGQTTPEMCQRAIRTIRDAR